jgi:bilirubin oxidase
MPTIRSVACALSAVAAQLVSAKDWDSPAYNYLYQFPMPIAPIKEPLHKFTFPGGPAIEYYEVDIKPFEAQVSLSTDSLSQIPWLTHTDQRF